MDGRATSLLEEQADLKIMFFLGGGYHIKHNVTVEIRVGAVLGRPRGSHCQEPNNGAHCHQGRRLEHKARINGTSVKLPHSSYLVYCRRRVAWQMRRGTTEPTVCDSLIVCNILLPPHITPSIHGSNLNMNDTGGNGSNRIHNKT